MEELDCSSIITEESYPIECYGLPERKAYPIPDKKHVLSAIRFFNYASADEEKELANKINDKIKEYKMKDINVGDKNRFKKYYKPLTESFTLNDFYAAMKSLLPRIQDENTPYEEKYTLYQKERGLVRMLLTQLEAGIFGDTNQENISNLINTSYATLAEISQNQIEIMGSDNVSLNSIMENMTQSIEYVLEADDEQETATNYDEMADDMDTTDDTETEGEEGGDTPEEEPTNAEDDTTADEGGDTEGEEDATNYDEMADDMDTTDDTGAEGEEGGDTPEDSDGGGETDEPTESENTDINNGETDENNNHYDNKELKNYFLLRSFLSMHETIVDVLDTTSGVILPTPDANSIMGKVVHNLQSIRDFVEKFIQFHFNDSDYAFNLYYYNIIISALKMNLKLLETAMELGEAKITKRTNKKED